MSRHGKILAATLFLTAASGEGWAGAAPPAGLRSLPPRAQPTLARPDASRPVTKPSGKLDINTATAAQLLTLPGIDKFAARNIIVSRPYRSIDELLKSGLSEQKIERIRPLVLEPVVSEPVASQPLVQPRLAPALPPPKVDLNSASLEDIRNLPGMEPGMAAHILAGRPFSGIADLERIAVPSSIIQQIRSRVTFGP